MQKEEAMIEYLNDAERARLQERRLAEPFIDETLHQLERILTSLTFARIQHRTRDFLGFVVSKTLIGHADEIKEMTVAIRVYHESADFDPLENSKVRVAGVALRRRVAAYYVREGAHDPIEIVIPVGTYVPRIRCRERRLPLRRSGDSADL